MKKLSIFLFANVIAINIAFSQIGAAINSSGVTADPSAMLDVSSSNQGVLVPRIDLTATTSPLPITSPVTSLLVYNQASTGDVTPGYYYWDASASKWLKIATGSGSGGGWSLSGNAGTDSTSDFIGTTDAQAWAMKTNNYERMRITKNGNVGIGTASPANSAILDISSTTKGVRLPNMTTAQRNLISYPVTGLQIYNTDCDEVNYYNGTCWISMSKGLPDPGAITGGTNFCSGATETYTIAPVTGASSYTWVVPSGAVFNSGQGSTSINVTFGSISGNVCVKAGNTCETSGQTCVPININIPVAPGNIIGATNVYPNQSSVSYSIPAVTGATSYNWSLPTGASIASGANTAAILVNFGCSAISGTISVTATTACGTSSASLLAVNVNILVASTFPSVGGNVAIGGSPTASGGTPPYAYAWSPSTSLSSTTIANPTAACAGSTITYTVTVTDSKGCTATNSEIVVRPAASAGSNQTVSACTLTALIGGNPTAVTGIPPYTYSWSPTSTLNSSTISNPTASSTSTPTVYTVTITDFNGCSASSSMTLAFGTSQTLAYTGSLQSFVVPAGVTCIGIDAYGAGGSGPGGGGGRVQTQLSVTGGQTLNIYVGGTAGFNGGGAIQGSGGFVGGGATDVRVSPYALGNRIIVAGGGGGKGSVGAGGSGGNTGTTAGTAGAGTSNGNQVGGGGGTQSSGGAGGAGEQGAGTAGTQTIGGTGGSPSNANGGGGGGGGYWCGGGGGAGYNSDGGAGGGGGSNYAGAGTSNTTHTAGARTGNGQVVIIY